MGGAGQPKDRDDGIGSVTWTPTFQPKVKKPKRPVVRGDNKIDILMADTLKNLKKILTKSNANNMDLKALRDWDEFLHKSVGLTNKTIISRLMQSIGGVKSKIK